ncbi:unnamed protein product [Spirodela intermedia]|uniref:Alpha/beta hydrolase fold-3 domain-containing protein n=1 Tax=Spirodela intermedia TaxID=51605 RepID=A0A7I8IQ47_SPIIN|nr:unnamed protein product [Spirodela intermedia]CAA6659912.1 unnamed protein product [Spirodela intermedia]
MTERERGKEGDGGHHSECPTAESGRWACGGRDRGVDQGVRGRTRPEVPGGAGGAEQLGDGARSDVEDAVVDASTRVWARFYVPSHAGRRPLLVYFHGGGFCLGSASWESYHRFSAMVAAQACCVVMSVNYRSPPRTASPRPTTTPSLPCDGRCGRQTAERRTRVGGGATGATSPGSVPLKGMILIQPFFGGEERTPSERRMGQVAGSRLCLKVSDTYWRLALPVGARRDHPWCNPAAAGAGAGGQKLPAPACPRLRCGDGHTEGQDTGVLDSSLISQDRTRDMISRIKIFVDKHQ